jgi:hypothetical protein
MGTNRTGLLSATDGFLAGQPSAIVDVLARILIPVRPYLL